MPLLVCATPIGNLDDVTLRVLDELRSADLVLAEDTRHTKTLLARHGVGTKQLSYHAHNESARLPEVLERLAAGEKLALVSDAGLPGLSDPGLRLVRAARDAQHDVTVLPGASAVTTALVASGFGDGRFAFLGFLPRKAGELAACWDALRAWPHAVVAFESPRRLPRTLASLAEAALDREVAVCRELTKRFEEVVRGSADVVAAQFAEPPKGEITLVLGPAGAVAPAGGDDADAAVRALIAAGTPRRAAVDVVARLSGTSRNELYRRTLERPL